MFSLAFVEIGEVTCVMPYENRQMVVAHFFENLHARLGQFNRYRTHSLICGGRLVLNKATYQLQTN